MLAFNCNYSLALTVVVPMCRVYTIIVYLIYPNRMSKQQPCKGFCLASRKKFVRPRILGRKLLKTGSRHAGQTHL